jgi:hypothetical protein
MVMVANQPPYVVYIRESVVSGQLSVASKNALGTGYRVLATVLQIAIPFHPISGEVGG